MQRISHLAAALLCVGWLVWQQPACAEAQPQQPHFASLRADLVHVRKGPGEEYDILWTYKSLGLPVEVTAEHEHWRRIRDSEGAEGWVHFRLLSALRTALITPWDKSKETTVLHETADGDAKPVAKLESGVKAYVHECDGRWCRVSVTSLSGWIEQKRLWGIYPDETFK
jgi:SH3-like domain-containing protein